jgi:predicted N-formylglutamate amidohydrolase
MKSSAKRSATRGRSRPPRRPQQRLIVSCEHGGNRVPKAYAPLFVDAAAVLATHRGYDIGALEIARDFGRRLGVTPFIATTTRLVVDLNRSPGNRNVFSAYTRSLPAAEREAALVTYYRPYRAAVERAVETAIDAGEPVLHVSAHSFTPELRGEVRNCDVGFLYDPRQLGDVQFVEAWYAALRSEAPELVLRRNYPYRGVSDSLVTMLRRRHAPRGYVGIELEVNQKHAASRGWRSLVATLGKALAAVVQSRSTS